LTERAHAVGRTLGELPLAANIEITAVRRRGMRPQKPTSDWRFDVGDAVVLLGRPGAITSAEQTLLEG
jgi:Trk K+ transport system NAD-binding subunit